MIANRRTFSITILMGILACCATGKADERSEEEALIKLDQMLSGKARFEMDSAGHIAGVEWESDESEPRAFVWHASLGLSSLRIGPKGQAELGKASRPKRREDPKIAFATGTKNKALRESLQQILGIVASLKPEPSDELGLAFVPTPSPMWIGIRRDRVTGKGQLKVANIPAIIEFRSNRSIIDSPQRLEEQCEAFLPFAGEISNLFLGQRGVAFLTSDARTLAVQLSSLESNKCLAGEVDGQGFHRFPMSVLINASLLDSRVTDVEIPNESLDVAAAIVKAHEEPDRYRRRDPIVWLIGNSTKAP